MTTLTIDQRVEILEKQKENVSDSTKQRLDGLTNASLTLGLAVPDKLMNEMRSLKVELRSDMKSLKVELKSEMKATETRLTGKIEASEKVLRGEVKSLETVMKGEMKSLDTGLRGEMKSLDNGLRGEMRQLGKQLTFMQWLMMIGMAALGLLVAVGTGMFN